jgi:hypothetical protein
MYSYNQFIPLKFHVFGTGVYTKTDSTHSYKNASNIDFELIDLAGTNSHFGEILIATHNMPLFKSDNIYRITPMPPPLPRIHKRPLHQHGSLHVRTVPCHIYHTYSFK